MSEKLLSVGVDVGTTTTQLVVSRLTIENRASAFAVPEMEVTGREVCYRSPVYFTPLVEGKRVDEGKIRALVEKEYRKAGITREQVDTGAIIVTGETSRKENAQTVTRALSHLAGNFVVATAGPDLESVLAAKGSGAVDFSARTGKTVLHMDIGGGTSNLAWIRDGRVERTGCLNVGGRLVKTDGAGVITYVSPVLEGLFFQQVGEILKDRAALADTLTQALEMAAGLRPPGTLLEKLSTKESQAPWIPPEEGAVLSFSGGVADCIREDVPDDRFGDIGPALGRAIRSSRLVQMECRQGGETIQATVIGAGCHSTQLSGSTVFSQNVQFPLKDLPVTRSHQAQPHILALPGIQSPSYAQVAALAEAVLASQKPPLYLCLEQDMAKALGQALAVRLPRAAPILCIDRIKAGPGSYLDVGAPVGDAFPVVVKTLVFNAMGDDL